MTTTIFSNEVLAKFSMQISEGELKISEINQQIISLQELNQDTSKLEDLVKKTQNRINHLKAMIA